MAAIDYLTNNGFSARVSGGRLVVSPASRLTDNIRQYIKSNRPILLAEISANDCYDQLTGIQIGWLSAVANLLGCLPSRLLRDGFIDMHDLDEQLHSEPGKVAALIRTNPRWGQP
ncbi:hypothetical protein [Pseudomonas sp. EL_65y_Pfl2_R95]|uniref:hypothetical protein n=1 Tax=Pseudomonas sp. EL_65y_Pfl2_R95 TaxID=3088698 RepID=UPI0030DAF71C